MILLTSYSFVILNKPQLSTLLKKITSKESELQFTSKVQN